MAKFIDITGDKYGRLTPLKYLGNRMWECKCDCGEIKVVSSNHMRRGLVKSCGCLNRDQPHKTIHGDRQTRLYKIWIDMRQRCSNPNNSAYKNYGGRGVRVCSEWNDYQVFKAWAMGNGYDENLTIERVDVDGGYNPDNCEWITRKDQGFNRRNNHVLTYNGETKTLTEWCNELNLSYDMVRGRLKRGWTVEAALTIPKLNNKTKRLIKIAKKFN